MPGFYIQCNGLRRRRGAHARAVAGLGGGGRGRRRDVRRVPRPRTRAL